MISVNDKWLKVIDDENDEHVRTIIKVDVNESELSELLFKVLCGIIEDDMTSEFLQLFDLGRRG